MSTQHSALNTADWKFEIDEASSTLSVQAISRTQTITIALPYILPEDLLVLAFSMIKVALYHDPYWSEKDMNDFAKCIENGSPEFASELLSELEQT